MSSSLPTPPNQLPRDETLYNRWIAEYLGLDLAAKQAEVVEALRTHKKTLVYGANGPGKTYGVTAAALAFLFANPPPTKVVATSGTYGKLRRTMCRPMERMHRLARERWGIPGKYKQSPPRIEFENNAEWFFEATRPRDAGELEGTHAPYLLSIVDEADKPNVDSDVMESMESLLNDDNDRMVVIANPPEDRANIVADLMDDDTWHKVHVSSFDSRNVRVEMGEVDAPMIDGVISLSEIRDNWVSWNRTEWPGAEAARRAHIDRDDLDARWYRRRAGVIPPDGAHTHRPFYVDDVQAAFRRETTPGAGPRSFAVDVARAGGDYTAVTGVHGQSIIVHGRWQGTDHIENETKIREVLSKRQTRPTPVDAQGEGSGLADRLYQAFPGVQRFNAGSEATDRTRFYDKWAEGLYYLGQFLKDGAFDDRTLREELLAAARVLEFEERHYDSRGETVLKCTSKDKVKSQLGRSPDLLDAAYMAVWAAEADSEPSVGVAFG